ncbi:hypothetical protein CAI21_15025 [Alkalilimnicola ehrlichii]|uniref:histidine kinase n=1 Tax=Alkalilimnicola ehrlichii TaxID=351052 RepID=A0A3E0WR38_9GAMM|nr:ATP-binding protein [Alkalilimnicola ehrlichii]RFA27340.1 hypothetical protein CAI21_15025 [Alkalilimnicola ehrlichii]RFA34445.1 hypothetical protein CAL65_15595 [Alkalilimnicola ehrlichii]
MNVNTLSLKRLRNPFRSLFVQFYLGAVLATVVASILIVAIYHRLDNAGYKIASAETTTAWVDEYHRITTGWHLLLIEALTEHPPADWPDQVSRLQRQFPFAVDLRTRDQLQSMNLPPFVFERLATGKHAAWSRSAVPLNGGEIIELFSPLPDSDLVVVQRLEVELPGDTLTMVWQIAIILLVFGLVIFALTYPLYRHVRRLAAAAAAFGAGDLQARANVPNVRPIGHLANSFNTMAERIQRMTQERQATLQAISHELRTPIARLHFALEMAQQTDNAADLPRQLGDMSGDLEELDQLVDELLAYSRLHRDAPPLEMERFDLTAVVDELVRQVAPLAPSIDLRLQSRRPVICIGSPRHIRRAVSNIIRNAQRYAHTAVEIRLAVAPEHFTVTVDDDGCGIPATDRERVFEAFARLDSSRNRSTGGYGLGLAIVQRVMHAHGGEAVVNDSPLGGARLILSWPQPRS